MQNNAHFNSVVGTVDRDMTTADAREVVVNMWRHVLDEDASFKPSEQDDFFSVGGDSLSVMDLVAEFRKLKIDTTVGEMYQNNTLAKMIDIVSRRDSEVPELDIEPFSLIKLQGQQLQSLKRSLAEKLYVNQSSIEDILPCTPLQEGIMYLSQRTKGSYHGVFEIQMPLKLDTERLNLAWRRLVEIHDVLRTRIVFDEALGSLQVILRTEDHFQTLQNYTDNAPAYFSYGVPLYKHNLRERDDRMYLILEMHHTLYDGRSLLLMAEDLRQTYSSLSFSPRCAAFKRFISYTSDSNRVESEEAFWSETLANATISDFPELSGRKEHVVTATSYHEYSISPLPKIGPGDITMATVFKAAWALLISKYTGSDDVCFGLLLSGRNAPIPGVEDMRGPTISTVPLRVNINRSMSSNDFVRSIQAHLIEMLPFQFRSLTKLRRVFPKGSRDFGSLLVVQPEWIEDNAGKDFSINSKGKKQTDDQRMFGEPYPLFIEVKMDNRGYPLIGVQYDPDVISIAQINLLIGQYEMAIRQLAEHSAKPLSEISLISQSDKERIELWAGKRITPGDMCVHGMITQTAATYPDRIAIEGSGYNLTYAQLEQKTNALAHRLLQSGAGFGPNSIVPVWMETTPIAVLTLIAVLKTGASYVPLDARLPVERARFIASDVKARTVLASRTKLELARQLESKSLRVIEVDDAMTEGSFAIPRSPVSTSDLAYVIYTSGSTGTPKGVMMQHWALAATLEDQAATYEIGLGTRLIGLANLSWDPSILEIFVPLTHGGCLCMPTEDERSRDLIGAINRFKANQISTSPAVASLIDLKCTPTVTAISLGGETIREENILNAHEAGVRLFNIYGPSEACIDAIVHRNMIPGTRVQNIGTPMSSQAWIVELGDPHKLAPLGCVGEIALSGTLACGYLNDPDKTARSFLTDCSYASPVYLTGDLGRFDFDGSIQFLGRKDRQVKVNGQRVELGEIENALKALRPDSTVVVDYFSIENVKSLVAFLVKPNSNPTEHVEITAQIETSSEEFQTLHTQLRSVLPRYMVPRIFVYVSQLPLSNADKVDFRILQKVYDDWHQRIGAQSDRASHDTIPLTSAETKLRGLWAAVLDRQLDFIQKHDNFFDLGADSLTIIKLSTLAANENISISITDVYNNPTLAEMAVLAQKSSRPSGEDEEDPAPFSLVKSSVLSQRQRHVDEVDMLPCNTVQTTSIIQGLKWHQSYFNWFLVVIEGVIEDQHLREACRLLSERHEALRTSFQMIDGQLFQTIHAQSHVNFRRLATCSSPEKFMMLIGNEESAPVSLNKVLTRYRVAQTSATSHILAMGMSHAQYDGFCSNTFFDDLRQIYYGRAVISPPAYSRYIRHMLRTIADPKSVMFWKDLLQGSQMTNIISHSAPHIRRVLNGFRVIDLPLYRSGIGKATFAMLVKTAWSILLSSISETSDVVFGSTMFGRDPQIKGMTEVVGTCMNVVPCRVKVSGQQNIAELVENVRHQQLATVPFETTPLEKICEYASWPVSTRFSTIVQHQNIDEANVEMKGSGETGIWRYLGVGSSGLLCDDVDCWIITVPLAHRISLQIRYNNSVIPDEIASNIVHLLSEMIAEMYANPNQVVEKLQQIAQKRPVTLSQASIATKDRIGLSTPAVVPKGAVAKYDDLTVKFQGLWTKAIVASPESESSPGDQKKTRYTINDDTSFFEAGGDSLSAVQLSVLCKKEGIAVEVQDVFDRPTPRAQAIRVLSNDEEEMTTAGESAPRLVYVPKLI